MILCLICGAVGLVVGLAAGCWLGQIVAAHNEALGLGAREPRRPLPPWPKPTGK